ncbi:flagellar export chaperone FliS [Clostridium formicaceticum]|uniref:Flagellar secretion chaperone FliS n=1 Tax=Clostridium formicaceticum TaxID=1497 RepID=A0AAC9RFV1_9CLOT|nr:flagellar export chaperone FliS [Clostridium formicaceticum]AOY75696.1 flagellar export chaperone FliS [Clostridium formicaceticum]ARE86016.1 Flagellar protein FliS [Clostridium formicaceticum]
MAMQNPYNQYKENNIMTASPENLTLLLYNGALKFIHQGKMFIEQKNIQKANDAIIRTQDIIQELNITLDMQYEVSKNLRSLYTYIIERLVEANIHKDTAILEEVNGMITELRDTWKEAMKLAKIGK